MDFAPLQSLRINISSLFVSKYMFVDQGGLSVCSALFCSVGAVPLYDIVSCPLVRRGDQGFGQAMIERRLRWLLLGAIEISILQMNAQRMSKFSSVGLNHHISTHTCPSQKSIFSARYYLFLVLLVLTLLSLWICLTRRTETNFSCDCWVQDPIFRCPLFRCPPLRPPELTRFN